MQSLCSYLFPSSLPPSFPSFLLFFLPPFLSLLHVDVWLFRHHLLKIVPFLYRIDFATFSKIILVDYIYMDLFLGCLFCSIDLFVCSFNITLSWSLERFFYFKKLFIYLFIWPHCVACGILVPWPGIEPTFSAVKVRSLNHWIAREFPGKLFKTIKS